MMCRFSFINRLARICAFVFVASGCAKGFKASDMSSNQSADSSASSTLTCTFNGQTLNQSETVTAYQTASVAFGKQCVSESRTCNGGALSGSFIFSSCNVAAAANCQFNGQSVTSGSTVSGYASAMVPFGQTCVAQAITCTDGVLSPNNLVPACAVAAPMSCVFNGQAVASGSQVLAYQTGMVPAGQTCASQSRTCTNGVLSGTYTYGACSVGAPANCSFGGATILSGNSAQGYPSATVPYGQVCKAQAVTCNNGALNPANDVPACTVQPPADCTFNGAKVTSGSSVTVYQSATVPFGSQCVSQARTCSNGTLSGTYTFSTCAVNPAASCTFNNMTVASGSSVQGYPSASVPAGQLCVPENVTCSNGTLSPSNAVAACAVANAASCTDVLAPRQVWTLSRKEYDNSVNSVLGNSSNLAQSSFPGENRTNGFTSNGQAEAVTSSQINLMMNTAEAIAAQSVNNEVSYISGTLKCALSANPSSASPDACVTKYINSRGPGFFRRPLTSGEVNDLYATYLVGFANPYTGTAATASGIELLVSTFLQLPQFYYRTEIGPANDTTSSPVTLTQYEIASAVSYMATGFPPDATLMTAAANNQLNTPAAIAAQYQRLIVTANGKSRMSGFVMEWLSEDGIANLGSSAGPVTPAIASAMQSETQNYINHAVFDGTGTVNELLTGNYSFLNTSLATYYGLSTAGTSANTFSMTTFPVSSGRAGLLSQGSFLVANSTPQAGGMPVLHRGHLIRNKILCEQLPSFASVGLAGFVPTPLGPPPSGTTTREQLTKVIGGVCLNCHQHFMPLGFALENFDAFAHYRTTENGGTVDPSGVVAESNSIDPVTGLILDPASVTQTSFADFQGMVSTLGSNPKVANCFANQVVSYISGRNAVGLNECSVQTTRTPAAGADSVTVQQQFVNYIKSKYFTLRNR